MYNINKKNKKVGEEEEEEDEVKERVSSAHKHTPSARTLLVGCNSGAQ